MNDHLSARAQVSAKMRTGAGLGEYVRIKGLYRWQLRARAGGRIIRAGEFDNVVTYVGQNQLLAAALQGAAYSVTGPYMGLISSVSYSAVAVGDTMASHAGWLEANATNAPPYGTTRPTIAFSAPSAGAIASSAAGAFTFTGSGTVEGAFLVFGAAATSSNTGTVGTLLSAGAFGTGQPVISGNVLSVSYSLTL